MLVAVGFGGYALISMDGINWIPRALTGTYDSIIWNGSIFLALSNTTAARSQDGVSWDIVSGIALEYEYINMKDVAWGDSKFVAVGDLGVIRTSP